MNTELQNDAITQESARIINLAKACGIYVNPESLSQYGDEEPDDYRTRHHESIIYRNFEDNKIIKVKDPFFVMNFTGTYSPQDVIYAHIVHNCFFPETKYELLGITEMNGLYRVILSQDIVNFERNASIDEMNEFLQSKGFDYSDPFKNMLKKDNEYVKLLDLIPENAFIGNDGKIMVIDPIFRLKVPVMTIITNFAEHEEVSSEFTKIQPLI